MITNTKQNLKTKISNKKTIGKIAVKKTGKQTKLITKKEISVKSPTKKSADKIKIKITPRTKKNKTTIKKDEVVNLPKKVDEKMLAKTKFYQNLLSDEYTVFFQKTTSFFAYLFVVIGSLLCFFLLTDKNTNSVLNLSTVTCSTGENCEEALITNIEINNDTATTTNTNTTNTSNSSVDLITVYPQPTVSFSSAPTKTPTENFQMSVETTNIKQIKVYLISNLTGEIILDLKDGGTDKYTFLVPVSTLKPANYLLKAKVIGLDGNTKYDFSGPQFTILEKEETSPEEKEDRISNDTTSEKVEVSIIEEDLIVEEDTIINDRLDLKMHNTIEDYRFRLQIFAPKETNFIEVYALPSLSSTPIFLGSATKISGEWWLLIDGRNLPLGNYNIFAKTKLTEKEILSQYVPFETKKDFYENLINSTKKPETNTEPIIHTEKVKRLISENQEDDLVVNINQRETYYSDIKNTETENSLSSAEGLILVETDVIENEVDYILKNNEDKINQLLKKYGSAISSGDSDMIRLVESEINKFRDLLVVELSINSRTKDISEQMTIDLTSRFSHLLNQVKSYEDLLIQRAEIISKDTDGDGITDFDEVTIYKTDPNNPDTDSDGVNDGVEIMLGYDPLNSNREAVINYRSPKDVNYVDNENLVVDSVNPIINFDENLTRNSVHAEIKGKGLPNSYVTLYIFSSPTVVTVRTDNNGDFVYTFTKELEDGEHEVYVAVTDNKGSVIARSDAFRFVKTAEAFSPVDTESDDVVLTTSSYEYMDNSPYYLVGAMGVISFGFILLMLGRTIRNKPEEYESLS